MGIIIGVVALVVMVSLVSGATGAVTDEISSIGNDLITVTIADDKGNPLRLEDLDVLKAESSISSVAPSASLTATAKYGYQDTTVSVTGTTASYLDIQGLQLESGRFLKTTDVENHSYVAILSHDAAEKLFGSYDPVGKNITGTCHVSF